MSYLSTPNGISRLPIEMLCEIFWHLDVTSLLRSNQVCCTWADAIDLMLKNPKFKINFCKKDIPAWILSDIQDKMFPDHWQNQASVDWDKIFDCWSRWATTYPAEPSVNKLVSQIQGVSSMQVSGDWLLISTREPIFQLTAIRLKDGKRQEIYSGRYVIIDFELVHCDANFEPNLSSSRQDKLKEFFDTISHDEIWLEFERSYCVIGRNYIVTLDKTMDFVRYSYGYRLVEEGNTIEVVKLCSEVNGPAIICVQKETAIDTRLNFWSNKIVHYEIEYSLARIVVLNIDFAKEEMTGCCNVFYIKPSLQISTYTWQNTIFFVYSDNDLLITDGRERNSFKLQNAALKRRSITSILFYCNHLLMGTHNGKIMIYKVKKPVDLLNIVPFVTKSFDIQVSSDKIEHITIAEPTHHQKGESPMILCASGAHVYSITFPDVEGQV